MDILTEEQLYLLIGKTTPDAVLFADRDGIIRLWNSSCERLFGYQTADVLGQSLDLIIPENLQARHWEGYHRVTTTGETIYGTRLLSVPARHRDGARLAVEFSICMIFDGAGSVAGFGAILRDVSGHRQRERSLMERIAELERAAGKV